MPIAKYIKTLLASKTGGPLEQYTLTSEDNKTLARAYLTVAQEGLVSAALTKVNLVEQYDIGSNFASNKYVAPVTGYYQVNWSAYIRGDGGALTSGLSYLYLDAAAVRYGSYAAGADIVSTGGDSIYLTSGQYLELYAFGTTASSTWKLPISSPGTFMSVYLIST